MIAQEYSNSKSVQEIKAQRAEAAAKAEHAYQGAQAYLRAMKAQWEHDNQSPDWAAIDEVLS